MHPLESTPVGHEWSAVLLKPTPDVTFELKGLHALALRGCWNTILEGRDEILHGSLNHHAAKRAFLILAAMKTRDYSTAEQDFSNLGIPITNCSFGLQLLHALLPFFLDDPNQSIGRLMLLLNSQDLDSRRQEMVIWCLVNFQTKLKNYLEALKWCNELLKRNPEDQKTWFGVCCLQFIMGDTESAIETKEKLTDSTLNALVSSLCAFSEGDFKTTVDLLSKIKDGTFLQAVAVNNRAISELFLCNQPIAVHILQKNLNDRPIEHLQEPLISSLCVMYDVRSEVEGEEAKFKLHDWLMELVSDDFDHSMFNT